MYELPPLTETARKILKCCVYDLRDSNTERSYIHPKMYTYSEQIYCIIFGNTRQRNIFSLGVIFIHFFNIIYEGVI